MTVSRETSQTSARVSDPDYSTWLNKKQAADAIGVTTKTVERLAHDRQIQQARWRRPTGGPPLAVYHPADVARLAAARRPAPSTGFLVPAEHLPAKGNGANGTGGLALVPAGAMPSDEVLRALLATALAAVSETSQTSRLFLTIAEAAAESGLTPTCLRRLIREQQLPAIRDRGWRIRRRDLEQL